jgi:hypothetical protein
VDVIGMDLLVILELLEDMPEMSVSAFAPAG